MDELKALADQCICHPASRGIADIEAAGDGLKDLIAKLEAAEAALAQAQSLPDGVDIEDLKDRLVAISGAVADDDDRAAQAILRTTLELLAASPHPQPVQPSEPYAWIRPNGINHSGVAHIGKTCPPGWPGATAVYINPVTQAKPEQAAQPMPKDLIYMGSLEAGYVDNKMRIAFANGARFAESHHGIAAPQPKD